MPDELHRNRKVRAAQKGDEPRHNLLAEEGQTADRPTLAELMGRLAADEPVEVDEPPEVTIHRLREAG
jgi:hypothetical protein